MTTIRESYGLKPPKVYKVKPTMRTAYPDLVMGTELEIEGLNADRDWAMVVGGGWRVETDGSLRGANNPNGNAGMEGIGLEFISHPMESDSLATSVHEFFQKTGINANNYSDRCSVHVHVNCQDLQWVDVACIALLYSVVEDCLFHFIGNDRSNNIFCIPWNQCRISYDLVSKLAAENYRAPHSWQKYTALNLQPLEKYGTVEFRHMEGTHDPERITQWLNIIGSIFAYCKGTNIADLTKEIRNLNTVSDYRGFFDRVFQGHLQYSSEYEQMLESGVIQAKLGSMNYGKEAPIRKVDHDEAVVVRGGARQFRPAAVGSWQAIYNNYQAQAEAAAQMTIRETYTGPEEPPAAPEPQPAFDPEGRDIFTENPKSSLERWQGLAAGGGTYDRWARRYDAWCRLERRMWDVHAMCRVPLARGVAETNGEFQVRVDITYDQLLRDRDIRVRAYRETHPRQRGEGATDYSIRTVHEADIEYYTALWGITRDQLYASAPQHSTISGRCRLLSERLTNRI